MASRRIVIDPEFASLCGPLAVAERSQLEANIEAEGCREPLVLWDGKGILVDGHNRYEICESLDVEFETKSLPFKDRDDARNWIINNQLGRRNITPEQASFLRGKRYLAEKKAPHRPEKRYQNDNVTEPERTHERLAEELKVSPATIIRDAEFAEAIDTLAENVGTEFKNAVLSGDMKVTKADVVALAELPKAEQKKAAKQGAEGVKEAVREPAQQRPISEVFFESLKGLGMRIDGIREQYGSVDAMFASKLWKGCDIYPVTEMVHELHLDFKALDKEMQDYARSHPRKKA